VSDGRERSAPGGSAPIFHLATAHEWQRSLAAGTTYVPAAFASEGFIHCSYRAQLPGVIDRYYRGRTDLVLLEIDRARLVDVVGEDALIEELSPSTGERFPHVYAPLPHTAVVAVHPAPVPGAG
jgi:uncharacterized protein (DUF952 family)